MKVTLYTLLRYFKENILIGSGPNTFRKTYRGKNYNECSTHPHNNYIQILGETGIIKT